MLFSSRTLTQKFCSTSICGVGLISCLDLQPQNTTGRSPANIIWGRTLWRFGWPMVEKGIKNKSIEINL